MKDIAKAAHVNQSTVSRVLGTGDGTSISAEVRKRILRIARQVDYHHNPSAVALRTGETRTVMVVVSDMTDTYYAGIISGVEEVLVAKGYSLILHSLAHAGPPEDLPRFMRRYHFDGVLMLGALPGLRDESITTLAGRGLPLVLIGRALKSGALPSVTAANGLGGRLAAEHLHDLGHRRIALMRGPRVWPDFGERIAGFRGAMRKRGGGNASLALYSSASRTSDAGFAATKTLLAGSRPTALFCINDATAIGALRAVREAGLRVPADVSVVGFDDSEIAEYSCPPLTSVRQPRVQMGKEGALQLMEAMQGRRAASRVLDVELVIRESTCPRR
jgi:LacI family transcriptional regulator, repressor for deo operon, udp, cdd, tsx, nupC, and nupG